MSADDKELNEAIEKLKKLKEYKRTYYGSYYFKVEVSADDEMRQTIEIVLNYIENSIPKKKIQEKLDDIDRVLNKEYEDYGRSVAYMQLLCAKNQIKELLEE